MKKQYCWLLSVTAVLLAGCGAGVKDTVARGEAVRAARATDGKVRFAPDSPKLDNIRVGVVAMAEIPQDLLVSPGQVDINPNRTSRVFAPLPGRVRSVHVELGDAVSEGDPLVTLESPEAFAALAEYRQALSEKRKAESTLQKATVDADRTRSLYEHRAVAEKELLNAEYEQRQAGEALRQAEVNSEEALQRITLLGLQPGAVNQQIVVRAPISGKVLQIGVVPGEYRNDTGEALMTVTDLSTVWITSSVPESRIRHITLGEQIEIRLAAYPGEVFRARVTRIADTVDAESRTIKVHAEVDNRSGRLRPEMFGEIRHSHGSKQLATVPASAVIQVAGQAWVWKEVGPGAFERVAVETGEVHEDVVPVLSGLREGDRIVVGGAILLKEN